MRLRARPWILFFGLMAACVAAIWGLIAYRNRNEWTSGQLAVALPRENAVIAYANLAAIRSSGLLQSVFASGSFEEGDYRKFVEEAGFDYKSDLDRVAISFQNKSRFAVAVGRFDWNRIKAYAVRSGAECLNAVCEVKGKALDNSTSFYPLHGSALALASTPHSGGVYEVGRSTTQSKPDDPWSSSAPLWVFVPGTVLRDASAWPTGAKIFGSAVGPADWALFTIEAASNANQQVLRMRVSCSNPEDAKKVATQLSEATNLLHSMIERDKLAPKPADLAGLLAKGKFAQDGTRVTGEWPIENALIQAIAEGRME